MMLAEYAPPLDVLRVAALWILDVEIRLRDGPSLGVGLLSEEVDLRRLVDRPLGDAAVDDVPLGDVVALDHQHSTGAATRVVDRVDRPLSGDVVLVARQHEIDHEVHDIAGREVIAGVLVERLVEIADQLLEHRSHGRVVDLSRCRSMSPNRWTT